MTDLTHRLDAVVAAHRLLEHPFYRRWEAGELTTDQLREYADQYRHVEGELAPFLAATLVGLPEGAARDLVAANLADELGPPSHVELFDAFAGSLGSTGATPTPATVALVRTYRGLAGDAARALGGLYAYEAQAGEIAASKARGLVERYGLEERAVTFWRTHAGLEDDHAAWTREALAVLGDDEAAVEGATEVAAAWWAFLDERDLVEAGV